MTIDFWNAPGQLHQKTRETVVVPVTRVIRGHSATSRNTSLLRLSFSRYGKLFGATVWVIHLESHQDRWHQKTRVPKSARETQNTFSHFDRTPVRDRQTYRTGP